MPVVAACAGLVAVAVLSVVLFTRIVDGEDAGPAVGATDVASRTDDGAPPGTDIRDFGAVCDGRHDDRSALQDAVRAAADSGGGVVVVPPGRCRIVATSEDAFVRLGDDVTLVGAGASRSFLELDADDDGYRELLRTDGSNISVSDLTLTRAGGVYGVLVRIEEGRNISLRQLRIDGRRRDFPGSTVHGLTVADRGSIENVLLQNIEVRDVQYGFLQTNQAETELTGVMVDRSVFEGNSAEDLSFNAPNGDMTAVTVQNSRFTGGGGFAVSLANVHGAVLRGNTFDGYAKEFVHIEDRSSEVQVVDNTFSGKQRNTDEWYSYVMVINASTDVTIASNRFEITEWDERFRCVYVGPGGSGFPAPTEISIVDNEVDAHGAVTLVDTYGGADVTVHE
ncbi:glycosyl hydrolase family 28-related protein [Blastococcus sp. SYSU DS0753]